MTATEVLHVREAVVIHHSDTLIVRVAGSLTPDRAAGFREMLIRQIGHLVNDVSVIGADGLAVIRAEVTP